MTFCVICNWEVPEGEIHEHSASPLQVDTEGGAHLSRQDRAQLDRIESMLKQLVALVEFPVRYASPPGHSTGDPEDPSPGV